MKAKTTLKQSHAEKSANRKLQRTIFSFKVLTGRVNLLYYIVPLLAFAVYLYHYIATTYKHLVPNLKYFAVAGFFATFIVILLTPVCVFLARKYGVIDRSKSKREPTPLLGGVVIYTAFLLVLVFFQPLPLQTVAIIIGATIMLVMGTVDDIKPLSSTFRLLGQILAAGIVMSSGLIVSFMPHSVIGNFLAAIITLVWILGIVNATNFIDGIDGLAAGLTMLGSVFFFLITLHLEQYAVCLVTAITAGSCLGFLVFNFKPAKIYLGDGGSTLLGFLLACFALYGGWSDRGIIIALGIPMLILGVLIFDMIYITLSRIKNGNVRTVKEWLDYRGRDHLHHRLMKIGLREEYAVLFVYIICVILGLSALVLENVKVSYPVILLLMQATLIFIIITMLMLSGRQITK